MLEGFSSLNKEVEWDNCLFYLLLKIDVLYEVFILTYDLVTSVHELSSLTNFSSERNCLIINPLHF